MSLELSGTTGVKGVAGSVSAPSIVGDDTNTGISFPSADTIKFSTNGVERMSITNSGVTGTGVGGKIKQWISTTKQDTATFSVSSASIYHYTDASLRVTITPTSASNFLYIMGHVSVGRELLNWMHVSIDKDGADFALASASGAGNRRAAAASGTNSQTNMPVTMPFHAKVSAESTAERYYSLAFSHGSSSTRTMRINRGTDDVDNYAYPRNISTITVIEVEV